MARFASRQHSAVLAVSAIVLCAMAAAGAAELAQAVAPVALLVSSLLGGCYPGETRLAGMATRVSRMVRPRAAGIRARSAAPYLSRAHGGLLIARSLCGRAPPLAAR